LSHELRTPFWTGLRGKGSKQLLGRDAHESVLDDLI
jgi:hypothetical protein